MEVTSKARTSTPRIRHRWGWLACRSPGTCGAGRPCMSAPCGELGPGESDVVSHRCRSRVSPGAEKVLMSETEERARLAALLASSAARTAREVLDKRGEPDDQEVTGVLREVFPS